MTMPTTKPPLDHIMYPHIIEDIIHYVSSSRRTLFALRCACGICNIPAVTDRYLVSHLVISQEGDSIDTCVEVRPHGCGAGFMPWGKYTSAGEKSKAPANDGGGSQGDTNPDTEDGGSQGDTNHDTKDGGSQSDPNHDTDDGSSSSFTAGGIAPVSDDSDPGISLGDMDVDPDTDSDTDPDWTCSISSESDSEDDDEEQGRVAHWHDSGVSSLGRPTVLDIVGEVQQALDDGFRSPIVVDNLQTVRLVPHPHFSVPSAVPSFRDDDEQRVYGESSLFVGQLYPDIVTPSQSSLVALGPITHVVQFAHWYERGGTCLRLLPRFFVDLLRPHEGTKCVVYNIIFRNDEKRFGGIINAPNLQHAHGLNDLVFLFTMEGEKYITKTHYSVGMLSSVLECVARLLGRPHPPFITFVGLENVPPQWVYGDCNWHGKPAIYVALEINRILRDAHPLWAEHRHRQAHTFVEILTWQQYREQVSDNRYRLEVDM